MNPTIHDHSDQTKEQPTVAENATVACDQEQANPIRVAVEILEAGGRGAKALTEVILGMGALRGHPKPAPPSSETLNDLNALIAREREVYHLSEDKIDHLMRLGGALEELAHDEETDRHYSLSILADDLLDLLNLVYKEHRIRTTQAG